MDLTGDAAATLANDDEYLLRLERTLDNIARGREELANGNSPLVAHLAGYGLRDRLLVASDDRAQRPAATTACSPIAIGAAW